MYKINPLGIHFCILPKILLYLSGDTFVSCLRYFCFTALKTLVLVRC